MAEPLTPQEREELATLRARLQAPGPELPPHAHSLAHARSAIQTLTDDLWTLATCILQHATPKPGDQAQRYFEFAQAVANRALDIADTDDDLEPWAAIAPRFDEFTAGLKEPHTGDCTAVACPCLRCHAELLYRLPSTVTWGKHEGYRLWTRMNTLAERDCAGVAVTPCND